MASHGVSTRRAFGDFGDSESSDIRISNEVMIKSWMVTILKSNMMHNIEACLSVQNIKPLNLLASAKFLWDH